MKIKIVLLIFTALILQSCVGGHTPEDYFDRAVLNTNLLSQFGLDELNGLVAGKQNKSLFGDVDDEFIMQDNVVLHMETWKIREIEDKIKSIKELEPTEDTKEMLDRSLALFNFVLDKYKTDYMNIAKLMDSGASKAEIDQAISSFDDTYYEDFEKLYDSVVEVGIPYAEANGINVSY